MVDGRGMKDGSGSLWERARAAVAANPEVTAIVLYAVIAIAALIAAYFAIFTQFASYDDEGTLLTTINAFVHGETLYRDVYSSYGPFYYELFGGLFALSGHAVTTDASRTIVIVIWVATSLMFGIAAQRLTQRLLLGAAGMIAAFAALGVLVNEPMHPQGLCAFLLGALVLLAVQEPSRRIGWVGAGAGAVVAALVLTKINLGAYAVAAVVLAAACVAAPLYNRRLLRIVVIAAFLAMPFLITARDLDLAWVRELLVFETLCAIAILVAARPLRPRAGEDESPLLRWLAAALVGFVLAFVAILVAIVLTGPSPADVYDGIVTQAMEVRDVLVIPFQVPLFAIDWGVAAVAAAALTYFLRSGDSSRVSIWPGVIRALVGLTILLNVAHIAPFGIDPAQGTALIMPMALAWVAAVPVAGIRESAQMRFLRVLLPALALAEMLQVYPVAGSQVGIASVSFVPVAALCLGDALRELHTWAVPRGAAALERLGIVAGVVALAVGSMLAINSIVLPAASNALLYRDQPKLPLPGASLLHLPESSVETYVGVVDLLHKHHCTAMVGYPSTNSLYLWSGLEAPAPQLPNGWIVAFDAERQQRVVDELRESPRPCALRSEERAAAYVAPGAVEKRPLVNYIFEDFKTVAQVGDYEFMLPKSRAEH